MTLPGLEIPRAQRWWVAGVPEHARQQVRVECEIAARHLTDIANPLLPRERR
jgi:hypothetical protein